MILLGRLIVESSNSKVGRVVQEAIDETDTIIWQDPFGRSWKLIPTKNENIKFPFVIEPIVEK